MSVVDAGSSPEARRPVSLRPHPPAAKRTNSVTGSDVSQSPPMLSPSLCCSDTSAPSSTPKRCTPSTPAQRVPPPISNQAGRHGSRPTSVVFRAVAVPSLASVKRPAKRIHKPAAAGANLHHWQTKQSPIMCSYCLATTSAGDSHICPLLCGDGADTGICSNFRGFESPLKVAHANGLSPTAVSESVSGCIACSMCFDDVRLADLRHTPIFFHNCDHVLCSRCVGLLSERPVDALCPVLGCGAPLAPVDVACCFGESQRLALVAAGFDRTVDSRVSAGIWLRCPRCQVPVEPSVVPPTKGNRSLLVTSEGTTTPKCHTYTHLVVSPERRQIYEVGGSEGHRINPSSSAVGMVDVDDDDDDDDILSCHEPLQIEGRPVTAAAHAHFSAYRLRCATCDQTFCSKCLDAPYHIGMTCSQLKQQREAVQCRFCDSPARPQSPTGFFATLFKKPRAIDACASPQCMVRAEQVCHKRLPCGHFCCGTANEHSCLHCLQPGCLGNLGDDCADDYCGICYVDSLKSAACIRLECGHVFHRECVERKIRCGWPGARITFHFLHCPRCNAEMSHPVLALLKEPYLALRERLNSMLLLRLNHEGLATCAAIMSPNSEFFNDPVRFAMHTFAYYRCFKCAKPYFGGFKRCEAAVGDADMEEDGEEDGMEGHGGGVDNHRGNAFCAEHLVCSGCVPNVDLAVCRIHGTDFIEYKCKYCCSIAQWYCWGSTHFCTKCHRAQERGDYVTKKKLSDLPQCSGKHVCPLGVDHPPNGTAEYALGCALCRREASHQF